MNQEAKKYYNLRTSGLQFEKEMSPTKLCDYYIDEGDTGHNYKISVSPDNSSFCDCGSFSIKSDCFCQNHKEIYDRNNSSISIEPLMLEWYETYCHFCIYTLFYYTRISTEEYRFNKATSIINSLILLCESDLSIYTYICTFFSSSIKKHNSLFNKKIVDIDRSFLTLINIKDQAPYICILFIMCSMCEDQLYQKVYGNFLLLLFKDPLFCNVCCSLYPIILWYSSICYLHFDDTKLLFDSLWSHQALFFIMFISYNKYKSYINIFSNDSIYSIIHIPLLHDISKYIDNNNNNKQLWESELFLYVVFNLINITLLNQYLNKEHKRLLVDYLLGFINYYIIDYEEIYFFINTKELILDKYATKALESINSFISSDCISEDISLLYYSQNNIQNQSSLYEVIKAIIFNIYKEIHSFIQKSTKEESVTFLMNILSTYNNRLFFDIERCYNINKYKEHFSIHLFIIFAIITLSEIYSNFGIFSLPSDASIFFLFIYHISLSQFLRVFHIQNQSDNNNNNNNNIDNNNNNIDNNNNNNNNSYEPISHIFIDIIESHFLSISEYYGMILQIFPLYINEYDPMSLFLWYIYKGYNYLANNESYKDIYILYNDISEDIHLYTIDTMNKYTNNLCSYISISDIIRLLLCIQCDRCFELDDYIIQKNKLSKPFLYSQLPNYSILLTNRNSTNYNRDIPTTDNYYRYISNNKITKDNDNYTQSLYNIISEINSTEKQYSYNIYIFQLMFIQHDLYYYYFYNNDNDSIFIPSQNIISKQYVNSPFYSSFIIQYIQGKTTNFNEESINTIELLHFIYFYIRHSTIEQNVLWGNDIINTLLTELSHHGKTLNIQHYSSMIQQLLNSHQLYSQMIEDYENQKIKKENILPNLQSSNLDTNDIICSLCNKKGDIFVMPVYIFFQNQQDSNAYQFLISKYLDNILNHNTSDFESSYSIYKSLIDCYSCLITGSNYAMKCPLCGSLYNFIIPIYDTKMFYHSVSKEEETKIYNKYKSIYENTTNSHRSFYSLTNSNNPKDIDFKYYLSLSYFLTNFSRTESYKYANSMIYDLFSESIPSMEYTSRFSLITKDQQYQLLYTRNFMFIFLRVFLHSCFLPSHCIHYTPIMHFYIYNSKTMGTPIGLLDRGCVSRDLSISHFPTHMTDLSIEYTYDVHLRLIGNLLEFYYLWNDKTLYNRMKEKENIQRDREELYVDENEVAFNYINIPIDDYYEEEYQQYIQDIKNNNNEYSEYMNGFTTVYKIPLFYKDYKPSIINNKEYGYIFERYRFRYLYILHCRQRILVKVIEDRVRIPYDNYDSIYSPILEISPLEIDIYKSKHSIINVDIQTELKYAESVFRETLSYQNWNINIIMKMMENLYIYYEDIICNHKQNNVRYIYFLIANIFFNLPGRSDNSCFPYTIPREYTRLSTLYSKPLEYHEIIKYCYIMEDLLLFKPLLTQMTQNYMSIFSKESIISLLINHQMYSFKNNRTNVTKENISNFNNISISENNNMNMMNIINSSSVSVENSTIHSSINSILSSSFIDVTKLSKFTILNEPEYHYNPDYPVILSHNNQVDNIQLNINKEENKLNSNTQSDEIQLNNDKENILKNNTNNQSSLSSISNLSVNDFFINLKTLFLQRVPRIFPDIYKELYKSRRYPFVEQNGCCLFENYTQDYSKNQTTIDLDHYKLPLNYSAIQISSNSIIEYIQLFFKLYEIEINIIDIYDLLFTLFSGKKTIKQVFTSYSINPFFVDYLYPFIGSLTRYLECFPSYIHGIAHYLLLYYSPDEVIVNDNCIVNSIRRVTKNNEIIIDYIKHVLQINKQTLSNHDIDILSHHSLIIKPRNLIKEFIDYLFCQFPLGNNEEMTILLYKHFKELYPLIYINNKLIILLQLMIFIRYKTCLNPLFVQIQENKTIDSDISCFFNYARKWERRDVCIYEEIPFEEEITNMLLEQGIEYTVQQLSIPFMRSLYLLNIILSPSFIPSSDISIPTSFSSLYTSLSLSSSPSLSSLLEKQPCEYTIEEILNIINFNVLKLFEIPDYFFILSFDLNFKLCEYPLLKKLFYLPKNELENISYNYTCDQCNSKDAKHICICIACGQAICFFAKQKRDCMKQYLKNNNNFCHCSIFIQLYTGTIYYFGREDWYIILGNLNDLSHSLLLKDINIENKNEIKIKEIAIREITSLLNTNDISNRKKYTERMYIL
ncbi:hypothetical protein WA158_005974 [Blastocystis sp. Blastoise]